jgi:hypothetical protein
MRRVRSSNSGSACHPNLGLGPSLPSVARPSRRPRSPRPRSRRRVQYHHCAAVHLHRIVSAAAAPPPPASA